MANLNFTPTRDWIVFDLPRVDKTDSGILIPEQAQKSIATNIVKVLAAGDKCEKVKTGDTVLVHPHSEALIITLDGKQYACVNEFQVVGILP